MWSKTRKAKNSKLILLLFSYLFIYWFYQKCSWSSWAVSEHPCAKDAVVMSLMYGGTNLKELMVIKGKRKCSVLEQGLKIWRIAPTNIIIKEVLDGMQI
jgi:hypothetical protein